MEAVNENVRSKNKILDYLKSINVDASNTHIEIELDSMLISVIKISSVTTTLNKQVNNYSVSLVCVDRSNNMLYNDVFLKEFNNSDKAEEYFNELLEKVKNTNEAELKNLIISY